MLKRNQIVDHYQRRAKRYDGAEYSRMAHRVLLATGHGRKLRTTNMLERLNQEIKRRTRVATLFPYEASLLRLVAAVLSEISDDWDTEKKYLTMLGELESQLEQQRKASGLPRGRQ